MRIRRLVPADATAFQLLRLQALKESPTSFGSSYEEECDAPLGALAVSLQADSGRNVFGAVIGEQVIGMIGVGRETGRKESHRGFIRSMYVAPAYRRQGTGRLLLGEAIAFAESKPGLRQITLTVTAGNAAAVALYESMGFRTFGIAPEALLVEGVFYDEVHMVRQVIET